MSRVPPPGTGELLQAAQAVTRRRLELERELDAAEIELRDRREQIVAAEKAMPSPAVELTALRAAEDAADGDVADAEASVAAAAKALAREEASVSDAVKRHTAQGRATAEAAVRDAERELTDARAKLERDEASAAAIAQRNAELRAAADAAEELRRGKIHQQARVIGGIAAVVVTAIVYAVLARVGVFSALAF